MKNILKTILFASALFVALFVAAGSAFAANQFSTSTPILRSKINSGSQYNNTLGWSTTTSGVNPGDTVALTVFIYNQSLSDAANVTVRVTPTSTAVGTVHTFTAQVSAPGFSSVSGTTTVYTSQPVSLSFIGMNGSSSDVAVWHDLGGVNGTSDATTSYINGTGISSGISAGSFASDCPGDGGCHQGALVLHMKVGDVQQSQTCDITNFNASPTSVYYGSSATLSWNTIGCTNVTVSGPGVSSSNQNPNGSISTNALYSNGTYTLTAYGTNGVSDTATVYISVQQQTQNCDITSFNANPTYVSYGSSTSLNWTTSNCSYVSISGPNLSNGNQGVNGSISTNALYSNGTYTLTAYGTNGVSDTATAYVSVGTQNNNNQQCYVSSFTASPTTVYQNGSSTLTWYIPGASYAYLSGPNISSQYVSGSYGSYTIYPTTSGYYTISANCTNGYSGNASQNVYIYVYQTQTTQYQCNDGYDNDGDGKIDLNDPGCSSSYDTDEYNYANTTVSTMDATSVTATSARLNGIISNQGNYSSTGYFEWGTTTSLGRTTSTISLGTLSSNSFWSTLTGLSGSTTYYYRAVATNTQGTFRGDILSFRTEPTLPTEPPVITPTVINNTTTVVSGTGSGSNLIQLSATPRFENVCVGDFIDYTIKYKNISGKSLDNVVIQVSLPKDVEYRNSSAGIYNIADHTVTLSLGTLIKNQEGEFAIAGIVLKSAVDRDLVVATATVAFTNPTNKAQETAVAYGIANTSVCPNGNGLLGLALFGGTFWPTTLIGWLLLILILLILIYVATRLYRDRRVDTGGNGRSTAPHYEDMDIPTYRGGH